MGSETEHLPEWRHLLPIPGLDTGHRDVSRPLRVVLEVVPGLVDKPKTQHLTWLLVTLLTRSTGSIIDAVGLDMVDAPLLAGIDPSAPAGGGSFLGTLRNAAAVFGPHAAPIVDADRIGTADLVLRVGTATRAWPGSEVLHIFAAGWTGGVTPNVTDIPLLDVDSDNPVGPYIAACLAAGEVFKYARLHDYHLRSVALNAWTLTQASSNLGAVAAVDPGEPSVELDHVLAGVGAVGTALLLVLWGYQQASGVVRAADADSAGVDDTNLNRCVPFQWRDIGRPKAEVAAERLTGHHGLSIEPTNGGAESLVLAQTHLISAVDTPRARQALQDKYCSSAVQASTSGLRLEMLRVDPTVATACLRCFNTPRRETPDTKVRADIADMDEATITAHAAAVGADPDQVRAWGRSGGCGQIGDALLDRLRPSDDGAAQFSVGFVSVLAGTLLAGQVVKDAVRRASEQPGIAEDIPLNGADSRFVANLLEPVNALAGVRRYSRDNDCPACQGIRADIWSSRWTG